MRRDISDSGNEISNSGNDFALHNEQLMAGGDLCSFLKYNRVIRRRNIGVPVLEIASSSLHLTMSYMKMGGNADSLIRGGSDASQGHFAFSTF